MVVVVVVDGKGERDGEMRSESSAASAGGVRNRFILIFAVRPSVRGFGLLACGTTSCAVYHYQLLLAESRFWGTKGMENVVVIMFILLK